MVFIQILLTTLYGFSTAAVCEKPDAEISVTFPLLLLLLRFTIFTLSLPLISAFSHDSFEGWTNIHIDPPL